MALRLPSRYEDLDQAFRGRLRPNQALLSLVKRAFSSMQVSGGIRFLPVYGLSGSGKTCAAFEIGTHLPDLYVEQLPREAVEKPEELAAAIAHVKHHGRGKPIVVIIDQYEEVAAQRSDIPSAFVERLSLIDRDRTNAGGVLFIWLTTSREFQAALVAATSRNQRILVDPSFELAGIPVPEWPSVIAETFQFHNGDRSLADFEVLETDLQIISHEADTIGAAIEETGIALATYNNQLHDLSDYQVVMLWPVTDGLRISRIQQFTDPRQGYKVDWSAIYRQMNAEDQQQLPIKELNRARLYFDVRLVPIAAADLYPLCRELDEITVQLGRSYLERFENTHFYSIISGKWDFNSYAPLRERESSRAKTATKWYMDVTKKPVELGRRIALCLNALGLEAKHEQNVVSPYNKIRADVLVIRKVMQPPKIIIELKAFSPDNTMPSTICSSVLTTLRRHAQFAGFMPR